MILARSRCRGWAARAPPTQNNIYMTHELAF